MIATCTNCSAQFQLDDSYLKPKGSKVRCARCHEVFTVYPEEKPSETESGTDFFLDGELDSDSTKSVSPDTPQEEKFDFSLNDPADDFSFDSFDLGMEEDKSPSGPQESKDLLDEFSLEGNLGGANFESNADLDIMDKTSGKKDQTEDQDSFEVDLDFGEGGQTNWEDFDVDIREDLPSVPSPDKDDYNFIFDNEEDANQGKKPQRMPGLTAPTPKIGSDENPDQDMEFDLDNLTMETPASGDKPEENSFSFQNRGSSGHSPKAVALSESVGAGFAKSIGTSPKPATRPAPKAHSVPSASQQAQAPVSSAPNPDAAIDSIQVNSSQQTPGRTPLSGTLPVTASKTDPAAGRKKVLRILLFTLLSITLLYCLAYYAQKSKWIDLPFELAMPATLEDFPLMNYFFPAEKLEAIPDPGDRHIRTLDVELKFIDNERLGRLLVLNGKIQNNYPHTRRQIRLRAQLFVDKEAIRTRTVYAGNILSDEFLARLPITEIEKELNKPNGDRDSNENVAKGAELPFMFVFADLPTNLSGYEINVVSSQQGGR